MKKILRLLAITLIIFNPWLVSCQFSSRSHSQNTLSSQSSTPHNQVNKSITLSQTCTNNTVGYQVNYPKDWKTNSGKVMNRCQVFDPQSAMVPEGTESTSKAIYLRIEKNTPFDLIAKENVGEQHLSNQPLTIANNQAVAVESESTGKAMLPEGQRTYSYIINLGDNRTFVATTYDIKGNHYSKNKQILDRMMETIEFDKNTNNKNSK